VIDLYAFPTPNSVKVPILLEELGADYRLTRVNIRAGEQKTPEFLALNPNGKIPVIVDSEGPGGAPVTIAESGAILVYLAEKFGRLIPADPVQRIRMFEWMFFHASGLGPAFGNSGYFQKLAPTPAPLAIERFAGEARRTLAVLDHRLGEAEYLAGDYSIADILNFGWIWRREFAGVDFSEAPNVARWYASLEKRDAVKKAIARLTTEAP
jgi:glutathione S-transferase